jgi:glycosyltransferase involved in cell wall biosynthesis
VSKEKLAVAMVIAKCQHPLYGTAKQALSLAHELVLRGVSLTFLSRRQRFRSGCSELPTQNGKFKVTYLPAFHLHPALFFLFSFLVWAIINRKRFQIIHAHSVRVGVIASIVGRLVRKKVLIKIPGEGSLHYFSGGSLFRQIRRWILVNKTSRFIAVSAQMAQALHKRGVEPNWIVPIPNGIELGMINGNHDRSALKAELLKDDKIQVVLFTGRLVEVKGLDRLLAVWARMPSHQGRVLLIVGDGPLRAELESRARSLDILSSVRFVGHQADVSKYYAIADLFVLPSKSEGVSNALLEAMAAGLPPIASNVGGNKDVIEDRQSGFLVDWEDTAGCVEILSTLLSDVDLRQRMGNAARRRARNFAMEDIAERYRRLYQEVLRE